MLGSQEACWVARQARKGTGCVIVSCSHGPFWRCSGGFGCVATPEILDFQVRSLTMKQIYVTVRDEKRELIVKAQERKRAENDRL